MTCGHTMRRWPPFCLAALAVLSGCDLSSSGNSAKPARHTAAAVRSPSPAPASRAVGPTAAPEAGASLIGLPEDQLVARLGPPAAERDDQPPAKTWRYHNKDCTVDFTLYPDVQTRIYRALAYEVINNDDSATAKRLCLAKLEARPRGR